MARMFLALQPSPAQRTSIAAGTAAIVTGLGGKPLDASDLHLTLCFLGEISAQQVSGLRATLGTLPPVRIAMTLGLLDWWREARVLCLLPDARSVAPMLASLASHSVQMARASGIAPDASYFRPHVTVGRGIRAAAAQTSAWPVGLEASLDFSADAVLLMHSEPAVDGKRYHVVASSRVDDRDHT